MSFLSTIGALAQAGGALESGLFQSQISSNNAIVAGQNANYAEQAGFQQATDTSMKNAATAGRLKTAQAANGVDVNSGSALDVQTGQREAGTLDVETVLNNADLSAYGYRTQQVSDEAQSQQDVAGGIWGATASLAENASSIASKWAGTGSGSSGGGDGSFPSGFGGGPY